MLKGRFLGIILVTLCFSISFSVSAEPENLNNTIVRLQHYHDTGQYDLEIERVSEEAKAFIKRRVQENLNAKHPKKLAIVFDIDETVLSNYPDMVKRHFGGTIEAINKAINGGHDPAIKPTLDLYLYAKALGIDIFFITGRQEYERESTIKNLHDAGFAHWTALSMQPNGQHFSSVSTFKIAERKKIENQNYVIIASVGDQWSDLVGGHAEKGFKLPNPYYYLP